MLPLGEKRAFLSCPLGQSVLSKIYFFLPSISLPFTLPAFSLLCLTTQPPFSIPVWQNELISWGCEVKKTCIPINQNVSWTNLKTYSSFQQILINAYQVAGMVIGTRNQGKLRGQTSVLPSGHLHSPSGKQIVRQMNKTTNYISQKVCCRIQLCLI